MTSRVLFFVTLAVCFLLVATEGFPILATSKLLTLKARAEASTAKSVAPKPTRAAAATTAAPKLVKPTISVNAHAVNGAAPDLSGHYWYHDRDQKVPMVPATLTCTNGCGTGGGTYHATLTGVSALVLGDVTINSNYVGFGRGPSPLLKILGGCDDDHFTIFLESDTTAISNIFAIYAPCNQYKGGSSVYTKNADGLLATLKANFNVDVAVMKLTPPKTIGSYTLIDRNFASSAEKISFSCTAGCTTQNPVYSGVWSNGRFDATFVPDGNAGFGTFNVLKGGVLCGQTTFSIVVPPAGLAVGSTMLAAAAPLPACGYAGQAFRLVKN